MSWCGLCDEKLSDSAFRTFQDHCRAEHPDVYAVADWTKAYQDLDEFWEV